MEPLAYRTAGSGEPLILLHGFCESGQIWEPLVRGLSKSFFLVLPDLPGHGNTPLNREINSINNVAQTVISLAEKLELEQPVLMGHSMGGYVTLAAVDQRPDLFRKFGLIHSTAFADNDEKKQNRNKSVEFIIRNGPDAFFDIFVPGLYHKEGPWVKKVDEIVRKTPAETLIRYTEMMRDRPDRSKVLQSFEGPVLLLGGKMDSFIPWQALQEQATFATQPHLHIFDHIGHLGMYEDPARVEKVIEEFMWL